MKELLDFSVTGVNWMPTAMLVFCLFYWIIVILGVFDLDTLDFDVDLDLDIDVDGDVDAGGGGNTLTWLNNLLAFFNLKYIPFMVWLTFLALPVWGVTVYLTWLLDIHSFVIGLGVYLPVLFGGLFLAKFLTWPLVKVFKALDEDAPQDAVGGIGYTKTNLEGSKKGQVQVETQGNPVLIMARAIEGQMIAKGAQVLVIEHLETENLYLVEPYQA
ncbi:MAG TPA: hypothetical protein DCE41_04535 [Cytophagales bacterium]|nr:hypothetical protein [Cytophagales bacterium]HAA23770.1 hypothetical protein [Cytophagales bacterium]HAP58537.1 hypothetical protein [Cytophagales bacterium]